MEQEGQGKGALWGTIIVIVLLLIGGYYFWKASQDNLPSGQAVSDEVGAIEADLSAGAEFGTLSDDELSGIEAEIR